MTVVWKYQLGAGRTTLDLPVGAQVLHVAAQGMKVALWALVDPEAPSIPRAFHLVGTGHELPSDVVRPVHVGSFLTDVEGTFVFHVFELQP